MLGLRWLSLMLVYPPIVGVSPFSRDWSAWPKPANYDVRKYEMLLRNLEAGDLRKPWNPVRMPNGKTDSNNNFAVSTDYIGMNYDYPDGSYDRRLEIIQEHPLYQKGLLWFLKSDPRVPEEVREEMARWGYAKDEFTDHGGWPHNIYVRESRRMISDFVMTENEVLGKNPVNRSIGMGSYTMDSHNTQRYIKPDGFVQNEGDIGVKTPPYQIDMGSILPAEEECTNLLVPVCLSCSHIAFGSIRMEPVFMILGQSAATLAVMAIEEKSGIHDIPYESLKARLLEDGQVLQYEQ